jgi:hypothetical protein
MTTIEQLSTGKNCGANGTRTRRVAVLVEREIRESLAAYALSGSSFD